MMSLSRPWSGGTVAPGGVTGAGVGGTAGTSGGLGTGAAGAATKAASINQGAQGVPAQRTAAGAEGSFTTTTITFPKSAKPTTVSISVSAASVLVQVPTIGGYFVAGGVQAANPPLVLDVSFLPESTTIGIQTEASAAAVIQMVANFV